MACYGPENDLKDKLEFSLTCLLTSAALFFKFGSSTEVGGFWSATLRASLKNSSILFIWKGYLRFSGTDKRLNLIYIRPSWSIINNFILIKVLLVLLDINPAEVSGHTRGSHFLKLNILWRLFTKLIRHVSDKEVLMKINRCSFSQIIDFCKEKMMGLWRVLAGKCRRPNYDRVALLAHFHRMYFLYRKIVLSTTQSTIAEFGTCRSKCTRIPEYQPAMPSSL